MDIIKNLDKIARIDAVNEQLYQMGADFRAVYDQMWKAGGERECLILRSEGENLVSPVVYPVLDWWKMDDTEIASMLQQMYSNALAEMVGMDVKTAMTSDYIRQHVQPRLMAAKHTAAFEEHGIIYRPYVSDLVICYYIPMQSRGINTASVRITKSFLQSATVSVDELHQWAMCNICRKEFTLQPLSAVLGALAEDICNCEDDLLWVLTNPERIYGAATILNADAMKKAAKVFNADVVILPSSVHEVLLFSSAEMMDASSLIDLVMTINRTEVCEEDFLADNIYIYHRTDGSITPYAE